MSTTTPINGLRIPAQTDAPLGGVQIAALGQDVDDKLVPRFATAAARDVAIPTPVEGQVCYLQASSSPPLGGRLMLFKAGTWRLVGPSPIATISGAWTEVAGTFNPSGSTQLITSLTIADPGFPYVLQIVTAGEIGATASGTRWDLQQAVVGSINYVHDYTLGVDGQVQFFHLTSGVGNAVLTGGCTVNLNAVRAYGSAAGSVTAFNRRFTASVLAAAS